MAADGKDYLEAMGGLWCTALGWGEEELVQAAAEQMRKLSFGHIFGGKSHEPGIALAEKLKEMAPMPVGKVFFANSGSEANDSQIKFMWYAANARGETGRKKIIARNKAYHGVTLASASLTGLDAFHKSFDLPFDFTVRVECPHYYRSGRDGESEEQYSARLAADLDSDHFAARRTRHHRRHVRGTGDGRRRCDGAAQGLLRGDHAGAAQIRHPHGR